MFYYLMLVNDLVYYSLIPDDFLYSIEEVIKCPLVSNLTPTSTKPLLLQILLVVHFKKKILLVDLVLMKCVPSNEPNAI